MRIAPALSRLVAPIIAVGVLVGGCGQISPATTASPGAAAVTGLSVRNAQSAVPGSLRPGTVYRNPANGRNEMVVADISRTAVLIGDSQSEPTSSWPRRALASLGYEVHFCGRGGTGFVASNGATGNYIDALQHGDWLLPYGSPPLVVIEGGGNDASRGASDAQISANAERLIASIRQRYPEARLAMVGTLARGAANGGGRRSEVNTLLGTVAARNSIPFVGVGDWLTRYNLTNSMADGVHMNPAGHTALGLLLAGRLDDLGFRSAGNGQAGSGQAGSVSAGSVQAESGSTESAAGR
ncbi:SGNH/GDSL hydrolase family protein [Pseudarthrobacter sp. PH31-O2]|uniref:SGNH/GDSL hydrolase family protein n=1 Tax=Pseudarthrobacter sp. PH31-O2 TaxID=3046206 RepID=UPI0024BB3576|nr:SGNH/GDSL hydrolase family protein [Pseudarthrobacter sp. PH31-O2]MDJ0354104.1 SGNH/GDSL hydrolase family protein [Pseudarthrobacter sp. PH31-O2]